jgi:hypothetical protein
MLIFDHLIFNTAVYSFVHCYNFVHKAYLVLVFDFLTVVDVFGAQIPARG